MELFFHANREPDMREWRNASDRIKYNLKWSPEGLWLTHEEGVTIVNSGADNGMDHEPNIGMETERMIEARSG